MPSVNSPAGLPTAQGIDARVLRMAGGVTLVVGVIATIIGTILQGTQGLIAGICGTLLVLVFFSAGQLVLGWVLANNPQMALTFAMVIYLVKIGALLVLLLLLQDATFFAPKVFAATVLACTLAWTIAEVWLFNRTKVLYVDPEGPK